MSKMHKCLNCGEIQSTGWGSDFVCLECDSTDKECLDHKEGDC